MAARKLVSAGVHKIRERCKLEQGSTEKLYFLFFVSPRVLLSASRDSVVLSGCTFSLSSRESEFREGKVYRLETGKQRKKIS